MSATQLASRRKPRQFPFIPRPVIPNFASRLPSPSSPLPTEPAATFATGFFVPTPAETPAAAAQVTLTASSVPTPEVTEAVDVVPTAEVQPEAEVEVGGGQLVSEALVGEAFVGEAVMPQMTATMDAFGAGSTTIPAADAQSASVAASPGGVAIGSIAGIAFFMSIVFLLYKWRKGTLPQTLQSATRALKFRRSSPSSATARDADTMEKGIVSETSSIHSQRASIHSVSSLRSMSTLKQTFSSLTRSVSSASSRHGDKGISGPTAFEGQQADKLAVPLPLHLARLEAAGLWTADSGERERVLEAGKMDPNPVVEEPDVHPLRAHRVMQQAEGEKQASWPL
ncbi:uncharacterized protein DNG_07821 [Cephalotrichum gorgonifer]|uniref:Uncharacterized protein n=1 Tax=Cephalotrichum gorgonifer TaxID=2041049 RepID=A0AAE8N2I8_9PEZI|nr:uncharacterized protein DNG_07821 [Cephalotrichum gorgonifer]